MVVVSGEDVSAPIWGADTSPPENVCGGSRGHRCTPNRCRDVLQPQPSTTRRPALLAPAGEWSSLQKKKLSRSPFWVTMTFFFAVVGVVDRVPPIKGGTLSRDDHPDETAEVEQTFLGTTFFSVRLACRRQKRRQASGRRLVLKAAQQLRGGGARGVSNNHRKSS